MAYKVRTYCTIENEVLDNKDLNFDLIKLKAFVPLTAVRKHRKNSFLGFSLFKKCWSSLKKHYPTFFKISSGRMMMVLHHFGTSEL